MNITCTTIDQPYGQEKPDTPRFLITLDVGIGDAVAIGLSAIDQLVAHDPFAAGTIDVLCNRLQAQIFAHDPRINRIIATNKVFFPGTHITQWLRGIMLDPEAVRVIHFLRQRCYEAVFPSIIAPGLYFRLHSHILYPRFFAMARYLLAFRKQADIHVTTVVEHMVNRHFGQPAPSVSSNKEIPLYLSATHVQKAMKLVATLKAEAALDRIDGKVLLVAPDTASAVTRPPIDLLIAALSSVLVACPNLLISILPSYTETTRSSYLREILSTNHPRRIFLLPAEPKMHLLETTALLDQADIFISGDTGVMHLAATQKRLRDGDDMRFAPKNAGKIVALFGGTSPGFYGYRGRTTIIGRGRKEQTALRPGISKESYQLKGRNVFDHISAQQIVDGILVP
ncbi:MAG TPA: glycosyltransferase family 9 protein [Ktedonobacteraceae bacterium]|jgi:ADP-heptose:LPS heptosyltransferase|nr:glycosyltransferase family 9 protein [Ktedonobacteraceae bacterium]